jgi:serine protease AprX
MATNTEILKQARSTVTKKFGESFCTKASDEVVLNLAFPAFAENVQPNQMIVEFEDKESLPLLTSELYKTKFWNKIKRAISDANSDIAEFNFNASQLLRQERVKLSREKELLKINPIISHIELTLNRLFATRSESISNAGTLTRTCWLNKTARVIDPFSLTEVASDQSIVSIDLPRQLRSDINQSGGLVGAPSFRKKFSHTGKNIIVAVIDSEVTLKHAALKDRVIQRNNYTKEPWGNPDTHGTAVAGIIASNDPTDKFEGMAPDATIYNYKVLATSRFLNATDFEGSLAIQQAVEDGVHIAKCSWGSGPASNGTSRESRACDVAWDLGLSIVKSAGNNGPSDHGTLTAPADARGVIVVGATDKSGNAVQTYSSRGKLSVGSRPHLVAPGGSQDLSMFSCLLGGNFGDCGMGTSFAAPHISGLLALLLERDPDLTPDEQRDLLIKLCRPLTSAGLEQGAGMPFLL